jgi:beta-phosphoglucomutase
MQFSVIFDMDGVIVDDAYHHYLAWQAFCHKYSIPFTEEKFKKHLFGRTNQQVLPELFVGNITPNDIERYALEKEELFCEIYRPAMKPLAGLVPFLDELKQNGIKTAIATSAPRSNVDFILNGLSIAGFFDFIVDDSMVANSKPNPEIYLKAAGKIGSVPSECVVFEDSLSGTKSAFDAGCKVIALTTTLPAPKHKYYHLIAPDFSGISVNFIQDQLFNPDHR